MFGISRSVRSREVQVCTPELFRKAIMGSKVSLICAEIEDALEKLRRGELKKEEYERMKTQLKSQLPSSPLTPPSRMVAASMPRPSRAVSPSMTKTTSPTQKAIGRRSRKSSPRSRFSTAFASSMSLHRPRACV